MLYWWVQEFQDVDFSLTHTHALKLEGYSITQPLTQIFNLPGTKLFMQNLNLRTHLNLE